jgi:phosphoglycolate phosphatase
MVKYKYKCKGIIFDLDGTLADTSEDLSDSINLMLESFAFEKKSQDEIMKHINFGASAFVNGCLPDEIKNNADNANYANYDDFLEEALRRYFGFYKEHCLNKTRLYAGIAELVQSFHERGIKMCVLSNKQDDMTKKIVAALLNKEMFVEILGGSERFPHKPNPGSSLYLADRMEIKPCETIFIGDSDVDITTAVNAEMFPLGVTWGYRAENVLAEAGAAKIVHTPNEISDFILNL